MWFSSDERKKELKARIKGLEKEKQKLQEEVEFLKLRKKIEDEDIRHMVKIKTEALELEFNKKAVEIERKSEAAIAKVKDEYRDKTERQLEKETANIRGMYAEILQRLPNVNVKLQGNV